MKVVCIKNSYLDWDGGICKYDITIGKKYDVIKSHYFQDKYYYSIINDSGNSYPYLVKLFITLNEYRNKRLEEIGI